MMKNLLFGLMTFITFNSFSQSTYTVTQTSNVVSCLSNDFLTFQDLSSGSIKTLYVNGSQVGSPFSSTKTVTVSTTFTTGVNTFSVMCSGSPSWSGTVTVNTSTGISENTNNPTIGIFPNPVLDVLKITTSNKTTINIFTLSGQTIMTENIQEGTTDFNLTNLPSGIYFVRVGNITRKVIKK